MSSSPQKIGLHLSKGDGTFAAPYEVASPGTGIGYGGVADLNGDGFMDVIAVWGSGAGVFLGNGDGTLKPRLAVPSIVERILVFGDFDGDGISDIVTRNSGGTGISVHKGAGAGAFPTKTDTAVSISTSAVTGSDASAGDFDGDGKLDLAVMSPSMGFALLRGNGNGSFKSPIYYSSPRSVGLAVADFNGDGRPDAAVGGIDGAVAMFLGVCLP
jgi:hypothetical protein